MSCFNFFSYNIATAPSTVITAENEDPFYPATNIQHNHTTKVFRTTTGINSCAIIFDLKTTEDIDSILVAPNALEGFGYTSITIEANATNEWSSPAFTTTLTVSAEFNLGVKTFSAQSFRFWRLTFGTSGNYVEVSKVFIGKKTTLDNNSIDFGWTYTNTDNSIEKLNRYKQKFIDTTVNEKSISASYKLLSIEEVETLMGVFDYHGKSIPVWNVVDLGGNIISNVERFAGYFYFDGSPVIKNTNFGLYELSIKLEEAI